MKDSNRNFQLTTISTALSFFFTLFLLSPFSYSSAQNFIEITQKDTQAPAFPSTQIAPAVDLSTHTVSFKTKVLPDLAIGFNIEEDAVANNLTVINAQEGDVEFVLEKGFEGAIRIKNIINGQYLEVTDDMAIHGGLIGQGERRNSSSQQFQLVSLGDGYYSLVSHLNYNLALEISYQGIGAPLILKNRQKTDAQAFKLIKN